MALSPEMAQEFEDRKQASKEKRARNRDSSAELLRSKGIAFESKNKGAHLIVDPGSDYLKIDFWPGTGLFIPRNTKTKGRGIDNLIKYMQMHNPK